MRNHHVFCNLLLWFQIILRFTIFLLLIIKLIKGKLPWILCWYEDSLKPAWSQPKFQYRYPWGCYLLDPSLHLAGCPLQQFHWWKVQIWICEFFATKQCISESDIILVTRLLNPKWARLLSSFYTGPKIEREINEYQTFNQQTQTQTHTQTHTIT